MESRLRAAMKGTYVLILELLADSIVSIGKLGAISFKKGSYAYVGSAMSGLDQRIQRHLRHPGAGKKLHWHIDYFLAHPAVEPRTVIAAETEERWECKIATQLAQQFSAVPHFGCSDCSCTTHLFFAPDRAELEARVKACFHDVRAVLRTTTINPV
jgi:Uri superfamily endonuclease